MAASALNHSWPALSKLWLKRWGFKRGEWRLGTVCPGGDPQSACPQFPQSPDLAWPQTLLSLPRFPEPRLPAVSTGTAPRPCKQLTLDKQSQHAPPRLATGLLRCSDRQGASLALLVPGAASGQEAQAGRAEVPRPAPPLGT